MSIKCRNEEGLRTKVMGQPCIMLADTDSTNLQARRMSDEGAVHGTLVCAEQQTAGRGRRGRNWSSPPGEAIYMSLLLRPTILPEHASMLTLIMGLAAARACNDLLTQRFGDRVPQVQLKWPNDLVMNGKKIAGILTELRMETEGIRDVIIGIGINVNTWEFPEELASASSLRKEAEEFLSNAGDSGTVLTDELDRNILRQLCMKYFEIYYDIFVRTEDLSAVKEEYEELLVNTGRRVRVLEPAGEYQGIARGINEQGELLVERENGQIVPVYAGEVSVRGVYGYV